MLEEQNNNIEEQIPEMLSINQINLQRAEESRMIFEEETSHIVDTTPSYSEGFDVNEEDLNNVSYTGDNTENNNSQENTEVQ